VLRAALSFVTCDERFTWLPRWDSNLDGGKIAKRSGNCWPIADATRPHRAQLYDSARALENIYPGNGDGAFITMAEAVRRLTIAKEKAIVLDMEIKRGARIPIEDVSLTEKHILFFGRIRGVMIASKLSAEQKNEILDRLRDLPCLEITGNRKLMTAYWSGQMMSSPTGS